MPKLNPEHTRLFDFIDYQKANYPKEVSVAGKVDGKWKTYSTDEIIKASYALSSGLLSLGIGPGDKVAIIGNNRPEWVIADLAILQIGAINVPIYPTISEHDYAFIFNDAGVKLAFVSEKELWEKAIKAQKDVETLRNIFSFDRSTRYIGE